MTPGGVSGEMLGIDAVREFNLLTDTYRRRIRQTRRRASQRRDPIGHQRSARIAVRVSAQQRSRRAQFFRPGAASLLSAGISSAARWADRSGRIACSSSATTKASGRRSRSAASAKCRTRRRAWDPAECRRRLHAGRRPQSGDAAIFRAVAAGQWSGAACRTDCASGTALSYNNPRQSIREDFGTLRADYTLSDLDTLSACLHHRRRQ